MNHFRYAVDAAALQRHAHNLKAMAKAKAKAKAGAGELGVD